MVLLTLLLAVTLAFHAQGGSASWNLNPVSGDWNNNLNWTPAAFPNGPNDVAIFSVSNMTGVSIAGPNSAAIQVESVKFNPGASAFTVSIGPTLSDLSVYSLALVGAGIVNNSGVLQQFAIRPREQDGEDPANRINFNANARAGNTTQFTALGATINGQLGGEISFFSTSSAASGTFIIQGGANGAEGGGLSFQAFSTAGFGNITNNASSSAESAAGTTTFFDNSNAGTAIFTNDASLANGGAGGGTFFFGGSSADNGTFTSMGAAVSGGGRGTTNFFDTSTADNASLIINGGSNGGEGGASQFAGDSTGGTARVEVFGNGTLEIESHNPPGVTIGSLEGDGMVFLGAQNLTIGSNNLSTAFSGLIEDSVFGSGGSLSKIGSGSLTLSNANTYTGGTTITSGTLIVSNETATGSATGTGPVQVNGGKLSGGGTIAGAVTIGTSNHTRATLAPAIGERQRELTVQNTLTFKTGAAYSYTLKAKFTGQFGTARADRVNASGVTIESGALFQLHSQVQGTMTLGIVFVVIDNTSASPISGTFSNLPDGAVITVGSNHLQASYEGNTGNDLTLTVIP